MPIYDYVCPNGHITEKSRSIADRNNELKCESCDNLATLAILTPPRVDWLRLGSSKGASPEAIDKFDKMHRQARDKEREHLREHGDRGPSAGYTVPASVTKKPSPE